MHNFAHLYSLTANQHIISYIPEKIINCKMMQVLCMKSKHSDKNDNGVEGKVENEIGSLDERKTREWGKKTK